MITINNLSMHYGEKLLFDEVNLALKPGNKYGLVGPNGAGKSTFIKILLEKEEPSLGEIQKARNIEIVALEQDHYKYENELIVNVVIMGKQTLWEAMRGKEQILDKGDQITEQECFQLAEYETIIADNDGYSAEARAQTFLDGLGIDHNYHFMPLSTLSGGLKLRVLMAKCLFSDPDYMLLDEPSNHLDIISIQWLENYLITKFRGTLILVSHDHDLVNNICNRILDIDYGEIREYVGNFNKFQEQKVLIEEQKIAELTNKEKQLAKARRFIERFKAGTRSAQAKSREKQIDKIELPEVTPSSRRAPYIDFPIHRKTGKIALEAKKISKSYPEKPIFDNISFIIQRGDRLALLGKNGAGKTTLLKTIIGEEKLDAGTLEWGAGVQVGYFSQDHHEQLNEDCNALEWLQSKCGEKSSPQEVRAAMGKMLFTQDEQLKHLSVLSGGEAARLLMTKIILEKPNIIILDEPTNHLDIETIAALEKALKKYEGTVIFVSHDRHFVKNVASRIIYLDNKKIKDITVDLEKFLHSFTD